MRERKKRIPQGLGDGHLKQAFTRAGQNAADCGSENQINRRGRFKEEETEAGREAGSGGMTGKSYTLQTLSLGLK